MNRNDEVFKKPLKNIPPFEFNQQVADCFDDMLIRSIPFYSQIHELLLDIVRKSFNKGQMIYDLGCSTGTTLNILADELGSSSQMIGIDNSSPMLHQAKDKLAKSGAENISLLNQDLSEMDFLTCGLVISNYTLQFIPPAKRQNVLNKIYQALNPGGIFFYAEKIKSSNQYFEKLQTDLYYDFKRRNGYTELEISQKREALVNKLRPLSCEEHLKMLQLAGFEVIDIPFRWYNFATFIGIK